MSSIQKVYVIVDEQDKACMVTSTHAMAKSYVNWFLDKSKKYQIESCIIDPKKMSQEEINNMLKEFEL